MTADEFTTAFSTIAALLSASRADAIRDCFARAVEVYGAGLDGLAEDHRRMSAYRDVVGDCAMLVDERGAPVSVYYWVLDEERVKTAALRWSDSVAASWRAKMQSKLGAVENIRVHWRGGEHISVYCRHGELRVRLEQDIELNSSVSGKLFVQFPARLYVGGKLVSEADFKAMTGQITTSPAPAASVPDDEIQVAADLVCAIDQHPLVAV